MMTATKTNPRQSISFATSNLLYWLVFSLFLALMCFALFSCLGTAELCPTDEATHGINAYEMIQNGNLWINTLRYETDYYNSKPPLMLWLIILGYKLFGYTPLGLRFFSALSGLLIYLLAFSFIYKVRGKLQALIFAALLPSCTLLFEFHMFRAGDMDAVYALFFLTAAISLYLAQKNLFFLLFYGLSLGLAFMTKGTHIITILAMGIAFLPCLVLHTNLRKTAMYSLAACFVAALPVFPWMLVRFRFDQTLFFADLFLGETVGRVQNNLTASTHSYFHYFVQLFTEPVCLFTIALILIACVLYGKQLAKTNKTFSFVGFWKEQPYLFLTLIWFFVVFGAYTVTKSGLEWYIYSAYLPLLMLGGEALAFILQNLSPNKKAFLLLLTFSFSLLICCNMIRKYPWQGSGGSPRIAFYDTALNLKQGEEPFLPKRTAYLQNGYNIDFSAERWEHDYMLYAMIALDTICKDGGVEAFLATDDMDAILFLSKDLWEQYAPVLTGYVIIEDSGYLVFSKHRYG